VLERGNPADILEDEHHAFVALVIERGGSEQDVQVLYAASRAELHPDLAAHALLARERLIDRASNQTALAERAAPAPLGNIPRVEAVEHLPAAVAKDAAAPETQKRSGSCVVIEDGHVPVHEKDVGRDGIEQLAQEDFIAHLSNRDAHVKNIRA